MAHSAQTVESAVALSYIVRAEAPRVGPIRLHYALSHRSAAGQPTETAKARPGDDRKIQLTLEIPRPFDTPELSQGGGLARPPRTFASLIALAWNETSSRGFHCPLSGSKALPIVKWLRWLRHLVVP